MKNSKQLERHFKGIANHHRLDILFLIIKNEGISLDSICRELGLNVKTTSEHVRRLVQAGLVNKKYSGVGHKIDHSLSPYGKKIINLVRSFSNS